MIFVGGIHGVGKGHICKELELSLKLNHYSASDIISKQNNRKFKTKRIKDVDENSSAFINGVKEIKEENYSLDGHFTLIQEDGDIGRIELNTFRLLKPKKIVLLENEPIKIQNNLYRRDGKHYFLEFLENHQTAEKQYSEEIAKDLSIEILIFNANENISKLEKFIIN